MKKPKLTFPLMVFLMCSFFVFSDSKPPQEKTASELSFFLGYRFWKDWKDKEWIELDLAAVIKGISAAQEGKDFVPENENALRESLSHLQDNIWEGKAKMNLALAEAYLSKVAKNSSARELVKERLYYILIKEGHGNCIDSNAEPIVDYTLSLLDAQGNKKIISQEHAFRLKICNAITGLQMGISGMKLGEKREIYIHPILGHGETGRLNANALLIFEVELLEAG